MYKLHTELLLSIQVIKKTLKIANWKSFSQSALKINHNYRTFVINLLRTDLKHILTSMSVSHSFISFHPQSITVSWFFLLRFMPLLSCNMCMLSKSWWWIEVIYFSLLITSISLWNKYSIWLNKCNQFQIHCSVLHIYYNLFFQSIS